jgi:hypothetical protein
MFIFVHLDPDNIESCTLFVNSVCPLLRAQRQRHPIQYPSDDTQLIAFLLIYHQNLQVYLHHFTGMQRFSNYMKYDSIQW